MNEELRRLGTRIDPATGLRSGIYGPPAAQIPPGAVTQSTAPMQALRTGVTPPMQVQSPIRDAIAQRAAVAPEVAQRLAQNPAARAIDMPRTLADVRGTAPASALRFPNEIAAPRNAGMQPPSPPSLSASANPKAAAQMKGVISEAAQRGVGAAGTAARFARGIAGAVPRVAGAIAGPMQVGRGIEKLTEDGGAWQKGEGAVRVGAGTLATLQPFAPKLLGAAGPIGSAAAIGMTAGDLVPDSWIKKINNIPGAPALRSTVRGALGLPDDSSPKKSDAGTSNPSAAAIPLPDKATAAAAPVLAPSAAPATDLATPTPKARGPISAAADRVAKPLVAAPASQSVQTRAAELQKIAGDELNGMRSNEAQPGGVQAFGPGDSYAGAKQTANGVYELPAFDNGAKALPDGDVAILRGNMSPKNRGSVETRFDGARGEERANMPEMQGYDPAKLFEFMRQAQSSNDPRVLEAGKMAAEMLVAQNKIDAEAQMMNARNEALIQQQQIQSGATLGSANIGAAAERYKADKGYGTAKDIKVAQIDAPVKGQDGNEIIDPITRAPVTRKTAAWFNPATSQWTPVEPSAQSAPPRQITKQQQSALLKELRAKNMSDDAIHEFMRSNNLIPAP